LNIMRQIVLSFRFTIVLEELEILILYIRIVR
jgi:hypothetical protein